MHIVVHVAFKFLQVPIFISRFLKTSYPRRTFGRVIDTQSRRRSDQSRSNEQLNRLKSSANVRLDKKDLSRNYAIISDTGIRTRYVRIPERIALTGLQRSRLFKFLPDDPLPTVFPLSLSVPQTEKREKKRRAQKRILFPSKRKLRQIYTSQFTGHRGH